jgi:hypothetical protein
MGGQARPADGSRGPGPTVRTSGGRPRQDPSNGARPDAAEVVRRMVDDRAGRRAATNQFTVARTCVLMKKASQRVRKCVLIRCMFQVTCSCRSPSYGTPAMPFGASPLLPGITGNRLCWWRRSGPATTPGMTERRVSAVAVRRGPVVVWQRPVVVRQRPAVAVRPGPALADRHVPDRGPRARPAAVRPGPGNTPRPSPRSLRGRGDRHDDARQVIANRRQRSFPIAARAPC